MPKANGWLMQRHLAGNYCCLVCLYAGGERLSAYVFNNPVLESTMLRQAPVNLYLRVHC